MAMIDHQERQAIALFRHWVGAIQESAALKRPLDHIIFEVIPDPLHHFTAQIYPTKPLLIEVSRSFLDNLLQQAIEVRQQILNGCLDGLEYENDSDVGEIVIDAATELTVSFVLLHELFHVLCGHVGELQALGSTTGSSLDEVLIGLSPPNHALDASVIDRQVMESYYRELETDNCALQCLIQLPAPPLFKQFLLLVENDALMGEGALTMDQCGGARKVIAYRFLLVLSWHVVKSMELRRGDILQKRFAKHPYPGARLLAAIATLFEEFAALSVDKAIDRKVVLDETASRELTLFNEAVLRPILVQDWPTRDKEKAANGIEVFPAWIAGETLNLLMGRAVETESGKELLMLDGIRREMFVRLSDYRYY